MPSRSIARGNSTQSAISTPRLSTAATKLSSCDSLRRFSNDCATDLTSNSSGLSGEHGASCLLGLHFQRRFTRLLRFERNIKHGHSVSCAFSSKLVQWSAPSQQHSTVVEIITPSCTTLPEVMLDSGTHTVCRFHTRTPRTRTPKRTRQVHHGSLRSGEQLYVQGEARLRANPLG